MPVAFFQQGADMKEAFQRTELMLGGEAMQKLASARVAVFGVGGVGGYVVEGLVRSGVGAIDIIDHDKIDISNVNRQIIATCENVGKYKVDEAEKRIKLINPDCKVTKFKIFYLPETEKEFDFTNYDYIVDAIDTVSGKLALIVNAKKTGTPIISAMGAGNKTDPTAFKVADIYKTSVCPLAKVMRRECKKRGIDKLKVVYSDEEPAEKLGKTENVVKIDPDKPRKDTPASLAFVPSVVGLIIAGEVVKDVVGRR